MTLSRRIIFLGLLVLISSGAHFYLWARLGRSPDWPAPWPRVALVSLAFLAVFLPLNLLLQRVLPRAVYSPFAWVGFTWMGLLLFLFLLLLAGEVVRLGLHLAALFPPLSASAGAPFWKTVDRAVALGALGGALLLGVAAMTSALGRTPVREVRISLPRWPAALDHYHIAQISDLHVGPTLGRRWTRTLVERINALTPDLIVITGDLADGTAAEVGEDLTPLAALRARDGVFYVTGNHEYYWGAEAWVDFVRAQGIRVLRNERVALEGEDGFDLAGIDDLTSHHYGRGADLSQALAGRDARRPLILLAHQPREALQAEEAGVDLQLSGHTHGGQIFPFHYITRLAQPYLAGWHRLGRLQLYVSRGTGFWGPPMRLFAPPEITRIEITPELADTAAADQGSGASGGIRK